MSRAPLITLYLTPGRSLTRPPGRIRREAGTSKPGAVAPLYRALFVRRWLESHLRWLSRGLPPRQRARQNGGTLHGGKPFGARYLGRTPTDGHCQKRYHRAQQDRT